MSMIYVKKNLKDIFAGTIVRLNFLAKLFLYLSYSIYIGNLVS